MECKRIDLTEWDSALPETGFEVFHTAAALEVLDKHTTGDLELLAGFKGDRPVALLPAFVQRKGLGKAILSPPPSMGVPRLGPLLMPASPKRRKQEKLNREFTAEALDMLGASGSRTLFRSICGPTYADPRPFTWNGLDVETAFTYSLDTEGTSADALLKSFSKSLRREIRDARDLDIEVSVEGAAAAGRIHEETSERYAEQDREYPLDREYVEDLAAALAEEDRCRVYAARTSDGEFLSGITALYSNDAAYFWQGGTRTIHEGVSINSLLHWHILQDVIDDPPLETVSSYDLMGANTERLCRYKSKFGADLVPYYVVESSGRGMDVAKKAYQLVGR